MPPSGLKTVLFQGDILTITFHRTRLAIFELSITKSVQLNDEHQ